MKHKLSYYINNMIIYLYDNILNYSSINNSVITKEYNFRKYIDSDGIFIGMYHLNGNPVRYNYRSLYNLNVYNPRIYGKSKLTAMSICIIPLNYHQITPRWKYAHEYYSSMSGKHAFFLEGI